MTGKAVTHHLWLGSWRDGGNRALDLSKYLTRKWCPQIFLLRETPDTQQRDLRSAALFLKVWQTCSLPPLNKSNARRKALQIVLCILQCGNVENEDKVLPIETEATIPAGGPCGISRRTLKPKHPRIDLILFLLNQKGSEWGHPLSVLCSKELGIF